MVLPEFNLLDDPWILASDKSGETYPHSIRGIFTNAHELTALSGELPTQDAAILRLLLGILYAVYTRVDESGQPLQPKYGAVSLWKRLWSRGSFSMEVIEAYLDRYKDRFWLFHDEMPFWQVKFNQSPITDQGITLKPTLIEAPKMIGDLADGDKPNLFCSREDKRGVTIPEAARWLVHINAFDVSPAGNPGKNPKTVKGFGHPLPASLGLLWVSGNNLFETLMLNLALQYNGQNWPDGCAWWEEPPPCVTAADLERTEVPTPKSIVELMSKQYRYIRLIRDGALVTGYELWSGVKFMGESVFIEPMTAWAIRKDKTRYPRAHDPARQMWRDFAAFASSVSDDKSTGNNPGVIKWLNKLQLRGAELPTVQLQIAGITYKKDTAVGDAFSDHLQVNAKVLQTIDDNDASGEDWIKRITSELQNTDKMVWDLSILASELALADGMPKGKQDGEVKQKKESAKEQAYFRLDMPFRAWLADIDPTRDNIDDSCKAWRDIARREILRFGQELVGEAGERAVRGHVFRDQSTGKEEWYTAPKAFNNFLHLIKKTYSA